jgi:hypothetical protein
VYARSSAYWHAHERPWTEQVIIAKYVIGGWIYFQHDEVPNFSSALKTYLPRSFLARWISCGGWHKFVYSDSQASILYILTCGSHEGSGVPGKYRNTLRHSRVLHPAARVKNVRYERESSCSLYLRSCYDVRCGWRWSLWTRSVITSHICTCYPWELDLCFD